MGNRPGEKPPQERPGQEIPRGPQQVDRPAYEAQLQQVDVDIAVQLIEEYQAVEFSDYLGLELFGKAPSFDEIAATLYDLWQVTGQKSAFIYVSSSESQLDLFTVVPSPDGRIENTAQLLASTRQSPGVIVAQTQSPVQHIQLAEVKGQELRETIQQFKNQITDPRYRRSQKYLENAQKLYQTLIAPIEAQLQAEDIDIIVLSMDSGLRSLPIAALHDGKQFLIEKYGIAIVPSFGLTDVSYADVRKTPILAMGASEFTELNPLPAVPIELNNILRESWQGESFLNQEFTVENFKRLNQAERFGIIHLATHGEFKSGDLTQSYIQFYNQKLNMFDLKNIANELGWSQVENPPIELLVLSACQTAVGSPEAELGFAGLAVQAGVKSALASLWYVSDAGTLGLMSDFYQELSKNPIKSQALQAAQIAMIKGNVRIENGQLRLSNGEMLPLSEALAKEGNINLSHPYFWSAFMMIGNWN
jgi:CHAT domain-containing protein